MEHPLGLNQRQPPGPILPPRFKMDAADEPQKKVFKARKTMKTSDRQQLEAIHKVKEDLLKPTEMKLVNGNHENGDSDMNSIHNETDSLEDKSDLNGMIEINCDNKHVVKVNLSDLKDGLNVDQVSDFKLSAELNLPESIACEDASRNVTSEEVIKTLNSNDPIADGKISALDDQIVSEGLPLLESLPGDAECSEGHSQSNTLIEDDGIVEKSSNDSEDVNPVETSVEKERADTGTFENIPIDKVETVPDMHDLEPLDAEGIFCDDVENSESSNKDSQNEEDRKEFHGSEIQKSKEPEENNGKEEIVASNLQENLTDMMDVAVSDFSEKKDESKPEDIPLSQDDVEAISSSMEVDHTLKTVEQNPTLAEVSLDKTVSNPDPCSESESLDTMETDEIIPILEKLAPVQDDLQCFSKSVLNAENSVNQEQVENSVDSPSKHVGESLPSEAFLVLSDEEEPCDIAPTQEITTNDDQGEVPQRKRSKSEDLDGQSSKRRRFEGEEYEAELKVKITAGDDLNRKLQKVIQRMFEEKLSALQCADFDKAIADLKTRVEKIECKKHENVLHSIQAKITRLTKRFGAAKEDLKRRPEQTTVNQTASPGKSAVMDLTSSSNSNTVGYRSAGTVRQMLESKRSVGETTSANLQMSTAVPSTSTTPNTSTLPLRTSAASQIPVNQPSNSTLQTRAPPDWKLIQQKINAQNTQGAQSKPNPPVTSSPVIPSVLSASSTATVVGNSQVSTSSTQPVSVSLQSLPVILHVPVAMPSQSQILQGTTGTLVTNQQSGNVEFIPVQNQSTNGNLTKTPVTLPVTKAVNSPSMPSPSIQRNSPASSVQAIPSNHPVTLSSRQSLPSVGSSGNYNQASNRSAAQLKSPVSGFNSSSESSVGRTDLQGGRASAAEPAANKRTPEGSAQSGKSAAGVIDLTLDDEGPELSSQDSRRTSSATVSANVQPSQSVGRPSQPSQINNLQSTTPVGLSSQTTIHVLPTAQTTVNITQRPGTQAATRASAPRAPHMVYTTTTLPTIPVQTPVRNTVMQNQNLRQMTPQAGGVSVRMPQTAAYVVNNGVPMGSAPQLTVHHRPPQEQARPIHPAPLPEAPQPQRLPPEATSTSAPQKPHLKLARVQSQNGIVLSWSVLEVDRSCAVVDSYHLYAYHEDPSATSPSQWKKIGEVKALPLPMACTLTQFVSGSKYYFAVRAKDIYGRFGPFCDPQSTDVISTQSS
ncbi:activating transcription factor 7-interacting protein 1 isoform X3 [Rana temporaria]|uniref:activating transcription factor 7-interacting protein 1 isoform X3 n=1 Tax=Rana temporaria TaxID=8407 RepID=UPI001AACA874|nr:activating transcription factor 7-interacting protein 1 isoform X3 [Rana temporaria]